MRVTWKWAGLNLTLLALNQLSQREECINLLVPVCLTASHIAYGSIRMEPVFMILAQSAATIAVLSLEKKKDVQDLPYEEIEKRLIADGQILRTGDKP